MGPILLRESFVIVALDFSRLGAASAARRVETLRVRALASDPLANRAVVVRYADSSSSSADFACAIE